MWVAGHIFKPGGGFRIDHPLDPENKDLQHSFVESSDMKNVYDGVEQLDQDGAGWVELPEWFGELNQDYRYQLTAIGGPAPELHIAEEVSENRFRIAGGTQGLKVSWQVTGVRKDRWAEANRIEVEPEKPEEERGHFRHPELYGEAEAQRAPGLTVPELPPESVGRPAEELLEEWTQLRQEIDQRIETVHQRAQAGEEGAEEPPEAT
jgi:hypothetical protein